MTRECHNRDCFCDGSCTKKPPRPICVHVSGTNYWTDGKRRWTAKELLKEIHAIFADA